MKRFALSIALISILAFSAWRLVRQTEQPAPDASGHAVAPALILNGETTTWNKLTPAALRAESVTISAATIKAIAGMGLEDTLPLQLHGHRYPDARVSRVDQWPNGTVALTADLPGNELSRLFIAVTGDRLLGYLRDSATGSEFQIHPEGDKGQYIAIEIDFATTEMLPCLACANPDHHDGHGTLPADESSTREFTPLTSPAVIVESDQGGTLHVASTVFGTSGNPIAVPASSWAPSSSGTIPDDLVTLNLMVVYSPNALAAVGNMADLLNRISLAVQIGNDVLANSDTMAQLALVHTEQVPFVEEVDEDDDSPVRYLADLTHPADDVVDEVHTLRATYQADFVSLLVDTNKTVGIANRPVNFHSPDKAFSVCRVQDVHNHYTLVHELAHNMGVGHSKSQPIAPYQSTEFFSYAAGWQWDDNSNPNATDGYCTVMTYEIWEPSIVRNYSRVPFFSNPDKSFNGNPVGHPTEGNAARVIRMGRYELSGYGGRPRHIPGVLDTFPASIDFEDHLAYFHQDPSADFDWSLQSGPTLTPDTGPTSAAEGTYYFYTEASNQTLQTGIIALTLDLAGYQDTYLSFQYHMRESVLPPSGDPHMGDLYLEISTNAGSTWAPVWSASGHQGELWIPANVPLDAYNDSLIHLRFRAVTGPGVNSDIALDDIFIAAMEIPPPSYATFIDANYPDLSDPWPDADPDDDGVSNFMEYALGMDLDTSDRHSQAELIYAHDGLSVEFQFKRAQATVRYQVYAHGDLSSWTGATLEWDSASAADLVPVGEIQSVWIEIPSPGTRFFRLQVSE